MPGELDPNDFTPTELDTEDFTLVVLEGWKVSSPNLTGTAGFELCAASEAVNCARSRLISGVSKRVRSSRRPEIT